MNATQKLFAAALANMQNDVLNSTEWRFVDAIKHYTKEMLKRLPKSQRALLTACANKQPYVLA